MSQLISFQSLIKDIKNLISNEDEEPDPDIITKKLKGMIEMMVNADKTNNEEIYDMFCELDVMEHLRRLVKLNKEVVIKTLSLLLVNLKNELWINHLMTDKLVVQIIEAGIEEKDEDIIEHYISFLKSLSMRLNSNNLSLFYNKKFCVFPLLYKGLFFYNHPDSMIRTSVMNLTLAIMKIKDPRLSRYFGTFPFTHYLINFCHDLNYQWRQLNNAFEDSKLTKHRLKMEISDLNDSIFYLYDIYQHGSPNVKQNIKNIFFSVTVFPTLISQLLKEEISTKLILYLLHSILKVFKDKDICEFIAVLLFGKRLNADTIKKIDNIPYKPKSFHEQFDTKNDDLFSHFEYELKDHCEEIFKDINHFQTEHEHKKSIGEISPNQEQFYQQIKQVSASVGFDILSIDQSNPFILLETSQILENSEENPIRQKILKLFSEGDDSLIWILTNIVITLQKKQEISNDILKFCGLLMPKMDTINYLDDFNINSLTTVKDILLGHLKKQTHYRIVTVRNVIYLLSELLFKELEKQQLMEVLLCYEEAITLIKGDLKIDNLEHVAKTFYDEYKRWSHYSFIHETFIPFSVFSLPKQSFPQIKNEEHLPTNQKQYVTRNIQLFSLNRALVSNYRVEVLKLDKEQLGNFEQSYLNKFNSTTIKWKVGKPYVIENRSMVECRETFPDNRKPVNLLLVEDPYNFVLVDPSTDNEEATIYLNIGYKYITIELMKSETNNMLVSWLSETSGEKIISFSNEIQAMEVFQRILKTVHLSFEEKQGFILKFIHSCEKSLKSLIAQN